MTGSDVSVDHVDMALVPVLIARHHRIMTDMAGVGQGTTILVQVSFLAVDGVLVLQAGAIGALCAGQVAARQGNVFAMLVDVAGMPVNLQRLPILPHVLLLMQNSHSVLADRMVVGTDLTGFLADGGIVLLDLCHDRALSKGGCTED